MRDPMRRATAAAATVAGMVLVRPGTPANRMLRRAIGETARRLRDLSGRLRGVSYRLAGRYPDPEVIDDVLADRVRSTLGPVVHRLDVPRPHVVVDHHIVELHGVVGSEEDAHALVRVTAAISGVAGVDSYLHVGLSSGDHRPSDHGSQHSESYRRVVHAARDAGVADLYAPMVAHLVLGSFSARLTARQREHVAAHLPADVLVLFEPPRRTSGGRPDRTLKELVARMGLPQGAVPNDRVDDVVKGVVAALGALVPEERSAIAATLPSELRKLWLGGDTPVDADRDVAEVSR